MAPEKRLFVGILNWGLGHAVRSIPLINAAKQAGFLVTIGTDGASYNFLKSCLPEHTYVRLPLLDLRYSKKNNQLAILATQLPKLLAWYKADRRFLERHLAKNDYCGIISDNRPGIVAKNIKSVYVTHQVGVQAGVFTNAASFVHRQFMDVYNQVWIPDFESKPLAGVLSHPPKMPKKVVYIGPLSDLQPLVLEPKYAATILLSGLEPQRTLLENALAQQNIDGAVCLIRGSENKTETNFPENWEVHNFAPRNLVQQLFAESKTIVARSGYTTLMDLHNFAKPALLIPTPGQTEQEYLAHLPATQQKYAVQNQNTINLKAGVIEALQKFALSQHQNPPKKDLAALLLQTFG